MFIESLKVRFFIIALSFVFGVIYLFPTFVPLEKDSWWPSKSKMIYGLDIQGGLHLVLSADINELIQEKLSRQAVEIKELLEKENIKLELETSLSPPLFLTLTLDKKEDLEKTLDQIKQSEFAKNLQVLKAKNKQIKLAYYESRVRNMKEKAIQQSIEVIRNRIDEFGVSEPSITSQGEDRILVQLPGIEESKKSKELIKKTAKLELAIVNEEFPAEKLIPLVESAEKKGGYSLEKDPISYREYVKRINTDLKKQLPENHRLVFQKAPSALSMKAGKIPYLVDMNESIQGDLLEDASVGFDQDTNNPIVSFRFQPEGRKLFSELTGRSIGKPLAVILDNVLKSSPSIRSRISDRGQISLGSFENYEDILEEANMIATSLRAGALPANLYQLEEKTVGPTLGKSAIDKGKKAGLIGLILVMIFMIVYYRSLGVIANLSLSANLFFLLALMSSLSAVLTLPGVAGIILTIGMAVDANVIIFERIKEELKKGASLKLAVKDGFGNAFSAILDANITTAIVCFVLIYFGSGPVRGFAVTLLCGILSSLFTAIFLSRTIMDSLILRFNWKKI